MFCRFVIEHEGNNINIYGGNGDWSNGIMDDNKKRFPNKC